MHTPSNTIVLLSFHLKKLNSVGYLLCFKFNNETKDGGRFVDILAQSESKGNFT